jgi:zinc/manganese transport system ATP-binding protein
MQSIVQLTDTSLQFGDRTLWTDLNIDIKPGEFIAVLGPNGSGKSTLLKVLLGLQPLSKGSARIAGHPAGKDNSSIGYIPQQKNFDSSLPIRGRDLVELGLNGNHFGIASRSRKAAKRVDEAIASVKADAYADQPIGLLSGGEQQRLRIAQALVGQPHLLLCDEPLLSLDINSQAVVTELLNDYRERTKATVIFVTHEINPVLPWADRVLYIANGRWVIDTPRKVLQTETLSDLYDSPVDVINVHGRLLVVGGEEAIAHHEATE